MNDLACYTTPEAAGRTASSSLPITIRQYPTHTTPQYRQQTRTLEKLLQKRALRSLVHLEKNTHHMIRLFPTIEGLLEVLVALVYEDLDRAWIGNVSVCFKLLTDAVSDVGGCGGDGVQGDDFGCLRCISWWVSTDTRQVLETTHGANPAFVEINDTPTSLFRTARHARDLCETGRYRRHLVLYSKP